MKKESAHTTHIESSGSRNAAEKAILSGFMGVAVVLLVFLVGGALGYVLGGSTEKAVTKYQCGDGSVVSAISQCPAGAVVQQSTCTTVVQQANTPTTLKCPSCVCPGGAAPVTTTTTTVWVPSGPPCKTDSECGVPIKNETRCWNGDVNYVVTTPVCAIQGNATNGNCLNRITYEVKQTCDDGTICKNGECVQPAPEEQQ
ncbi:Uncharacterised protein [uncultured archaeon]|nr:Uncharacterised protein [uncultured archaeon]